MGKSSGGSGKGGGKSGSSMSKSDASRIQSAGARNKESATAKSGFHERAQSAADRRANQQSQADT